MKQTSLQSTLSNLLTQFGKENYKNFSLDQMKNIIGDALDDTSVHSPAEKAVILKMKSKFKKMSTKEDILTEITEKMFSLTESI